MDKPMTEDRTKPNPNYVPAEYKWFELCLISGPFSKKMRAMFRRNQRTSRRQRRAFLAGKVIPVIYRRQNGTWHTPTP